MVENVIDKKLWDEIDNNLGEVSDFNMSEQDGHIIINFKTNGVEKQIVSNDLSMKNFIQSLAYCANAFSHKPVVFKPSF